MKEFVADNTGIGPADTADRVTWSELSDVLATAFSPFSSAGELRTRLVALIEQGVIEGDVDRLKAVLAGTGGEIRIQHPDFGNEEIARVAGGED